MSSRELHRVEVLARVKSMELQLKEAACLLKVSYRQTKRLWRRYQEEGAVSLKHGSAGRRSNRAKPEQFRRKVLKLVREKYSGAAGERSGPTLAAEHLASEDGLEVDAETLRPGCWRKGCGVERGSTSRTASAVHDGSTSVSWCSWTVAFMSGWRSAARERA